MGKTCSGRGGSVRLTRATLLLLAGALMAMLVMPGVAAAYDDAMDEADDVFETAPSLGYAPIIGYVSADVTDPGVDYSDHYAITLAAGEKFTIRVAADSGNYMMSDDTPEKNHVVRQPDGTPFFRPIDGVVEITYTPTQAGKYYVIVWADTGIRTNYTLTWTAAKHITVTKPNAPTTMYKGRARTISGYLKPRHTAGTYPVRIYKYRRVSGGWKSYGYVNAKASNYSTYTKYTKTFSLPYKGNWRLRAVAPADSEHAKTYSSYDYVTVK